MLTDPTVTSITVDPPLSPHELQSTNSPSRIANVKRHTNPTAHGFCGHKAQLRPTARGRRHTGRRAARADGASFHRHYSGLLLGHRDQNNRISPARVGHTASSRSHCDLSGMREQFGLHPVRAEIHSQATGVRMLLYPVAHRRVGLAGDDDQVRGFVAMILCMAV